MSNAPNPFAPVSGQEESAAAQTQPASVAPPPQPRVPAQKQADANKPKGGSDTGRHKFLEFTISGCYYNSRKETIDFEDVKGKIPYCDEENGVGSMHVRSRYAVKWIKEAVDSKGEKLYPERIEKIRQVFIDDVQPATGTLSFVGKNIKELSIDEMQELAVAKDLRFIPIPGKGLSKRDMLIRAYVAYAEKVLFKKIKWQEPDFNFSALPDIILDDKTRVEEGGKISNDEMIEREMSSKRTDSPKARFTIEELKTIADSKNISYSDDVEFSDLYNTLFSG